MGVIILKGRGVGCRVWGVGCVEYYGGVKVWGIRINKGLGWKTEY